MQTFLPLPSVEDSLTHLDTQRLGKQRVEAYQILRALRGTGPQGWRNHPATRMWQGSLPFLAHYYNRCIDEWVRRGKRNTMAKDRSARSTRPPWWFGHRVFHRSHQCQLWLKHHGPASTPERRRRTVPAPAALGEWMPHGSDWQGYVWPTAEMELHRCGRQGLYLYCPRRKRVIAAGAGEWVDQCWVFQTYQLGRRDAIGTKPVCWMVPDRNYKRN